MAKYITVYLVRHGQTAWNVKQITQGSKASRLNKTGQRQAARMARYFKDIRLDAIYSSPLMRAMQTARAVLKYHDASKLVKWYDFRERYAGKFEGTSMKQKLKLMPDLKEQWKKKGVDWRAPGGESMREVSKRSIAGFKKMIKRHKPGDAVLIVSHGGVLKCLIHKFHGGAFKDFFHREPVGNCEITKVLWDNGPKRVSCVLK